MTKINGIMLKHNDNDLEYYSPNFTPNDAAVIFKILEKYGDNNESMRGALTVIETEPEPTPEPVHDCNNCPMLYDCDNSGYYETCKKSAQNVIKYDYNGASKLFDRYLDIICDMTLTSYELQPLRRDFLRAVTRHVDIKSYIDYLYELRDDARPVENAKSRCFDFEYERDIENLIYDIKTFYSSQKGA